MKKLRIGIQGVKAAFHEVAARKYFSNAELEFVECATFPRLCQALQNKETDFNMMAIENSIAGSILPNYLLLEKFNLKVIGEVYLRIEMNLMALPNQTIQQLHTVMSHPMALLQCQDFLNQYPHIKIQEANDTAESAKEIKMKDMKGVGAIASRLASEVYGLPLLAQNIESDKNNYTRFLAVSRGEVFKEEIPDKSSLRFEVSHRPGSLLSILSSFVSHGINMSKLQSVPIIGRPQEYSFHVDLEFKDADEYRHAIEELKLKTVNLIEFGLYKKDSWGAV
jgi:prephenate dehydratase